ncbi:MAG: NDP-sugar synthase [Bacteroidales bacterium]
MKPTLVLLAAGMGSRYGGLKQVDAVGPSGETIMDYSIYDALRAGFGKIIFVIRKEIEADFRKAFTDKFEKKIEFDFVYQELDNLPPGFELPKDRVKPWGTGHAVMVAADKVKEPFAVINADDFYGQDAYVKMNQFLTGTTKAISYSMVGYKLKNTLSEFGFVSRGICETDKNGILLSVTERTKIRKEHQRILFENESGVLTEIEGDSVVSMNFWGFKPEFFQQLKSLFTLFIKETNDIQKSEFYLSSAIDTLIKAGEAQVKVLHTDAQWFGVTYKEDKPEVITRILTSVKKGSYPENLWGTYNG